MKKGPVCPGANPDHETKEDTVTTETTIAETAHRVVSAWKGDEPGSCGIECSCGDTFDGFDSIAEAEACHKPLQADKPEPVKAEPDPRAEYIAGLRHLADLLEQNPELIAPYDGRSALSPLCVIPTGHDAQRAQLTAWARALPGRKDKSPRGDAFDLIGAVRGVHIKVICNRDAVCEKVVLGVETVTETVPDPDYMANAPLVERETVKEIVEWICSPSILADEPAQVTA